VVFHHSYFPGFRQELPYNVACVRLAEGPLLFTNLVGVEQGSLRVDMPVQVQFIDVTPEWSLPMFVPVDGWVSGDGARGICDD
jgi:hypothetical protein